MIQANNFHYNHFPDRRFDGICFLPTLGSDFICSLRRGELRESCFRRQFRASWNSALRTNCLQTMDLHFDCFSWFRLHPIMTGKSSLSSIYSMYLATLSLLLRSLWFFSLR